MNQVLQQSGDVELFLWNNKDVSTGGKLLENLNTWLCWRWNWLCDSIVSVGGGWNTRVELLQKKSEVPFRLVTTRLCKLLLGRPSTLQQQSITYNLDMIIFKLNYKKALRIQWQHSRQPDCSNLPKSVKLNQLQQILMTSRLSFSLVPRPHPARISLPV